MATLAGRASAAPQGPTRVPAVCRALARTGRRLDPAVAPALGAPASSFPLEAGLALAAGAVRKLAGIKEGNVRNLEPVPAATDLTLRAIDQGPALAVDQARAPAVLPPATSATF